MPNSSLTSGKSTKQTMQRAERLWKISVKAALWPLFLRTVLTSLQAKLILFGCYKGQRDVMGLAGRVVQTQVYNHTQAEPRQRSCLQNKLVPGWYTSTAWSGCQSCSGHNAELSLMNPWNISPWNSRNTSLTWACAAAGPQAGSQQTSDAFRRGLSRPPVSTTTSEQMAFHKKNKRLPLLPPNSACPSGAFWHGNVDSGVVWF